MPVQSSEAFAANLRRRRLARKMTQEQLGHAAGLHMTEISRLESGQRDPHLSTLVRLAGALDVRVGDLVRGLGPEPRASTGQKRRKARPKLTWPSQG